jgi:sulfite reductase (NADPH) hemoprotein beta-component
MQANATLPVGTYGYQRVDLDFLNDRAAQFRDQVARRLSGDLSEDEFKPLRLMNGLYLQLHAYMLRVAIPYGVLSAAQLRRLARIARIYDRGYGHFTTRQNIQFNWIKLEEAPDILAELAEVGMHAIQTSGNCIRNITSDEFAGAAADELVDPRVHAEILRQWSTLHPEFSFLPRKFKFAISGSPHDRVAARFHDIGLIAKPGADGAVGFEVFAGGGLGRTPMIGIRLREWLPEHELLAYMEAILRVYNAYGRRDNLYKARLKILVQAVGRDAFAEKVEAEFAAIPKDCCRLSSLSSVPNPKFLQTITTGRRWRANRRIRMTLFSERLAVHKARC